MALWRKALNGATVSELHISWSFSTSALDLLTAGKGSNFTALAAWTAKLSLIDNLPLQQAAGDEPGVATIWKAPVRISIVDTIPNNYRGYFSQGGEVRTMSRLFSLALCGYSTDAALIKPDAVDHIEMQCKGDCFIIVPGFDFHFLALRSTTAPRTNPSPNKWQ